MMTNGGMSSRFLPYSFLYRESGTHITQSGGLPAAGSSISIINILSLTSLQSGIFKIPGMKPFYLIYKYVYIHIKHLIRVRYMNNHISVKYERNGVGFLRGFGIKIRIHFLAH